MTQRLVALMSVVLLLSLAAFGLLMNAYQERVMDEVARTASEVGRATLNSFQQPVWVVERDGAAAGLPAGLPDFELQQAAGLEGTNVESHVILIERIDTDAAFFQSGNAFQFETTSGCDQADSAQACAALEALHGKLRARGERPSSIRRSGEDPAPGIAQIFLTSDAVHVTGDPNEGLTLRIPTLRTSKRADGSVTVDLQVGTHHGLHDAPPEPGSVVENVEHNADGTETHTRSWTTRSKSGTPVEVQVREMRRTTEAGEEARVDSFRTEWRTETATVPRTDRAPAADSDATGVMGPGELEAMRASAGSAVPGASDVMVAKRQDIELPIPLNDYQELFASMRNRSLMVFLGVFVVGTVLSAGLASRFTRPIRRLDAGIHRISAGDLDVEVPVEGKGEIARLGRAFNEMTARLRAGRERSREMVRQEKLSALGGLAAGVAHDVRNPLHSISLTLEHLRETCRPDEAGRSAQFDEAVDIIRGEVRRLDGLVTNFLRFARNERRPRQPVDLAALLQETAQLIHKEAEWRKVDVRADINVAAPSVLADGEAIRSSVLNLILNAFEAMPQGGTLRLGMGVEDRYVRVEVADDGRGIPEADRERVFDFAYTTRERGSGLGLAMVHQHIVEEHGGRIALESEVGQGTTVLLYLPIHGNQPAEDATA